MENFAQGFVALLQYLLPGFLAAWVFYGLTSHPKPSQFERVVQALIFTLVVQAVTYGLGEALHAGGWAVSTAGLDTGSGVATSVVSAFVVGAVFAFGANSDLAHRGCRKIGITRETAYPSEWFGAFLKNVTYIVLHFHDERRLYGWPIEWPSEPKQGHFVIQQPSWLTDNGEEPVTGVESILVDVEDVMWVEFMAKSWEQSNGQKESESPAAQAE